MARFSRVLAACLLAAPLAQAACPPAAELVRALYPQAPAADSRGLVQVDDGLKIALTPLSATDAPGIICKVWPADENMLLVAAVLREPDPEPAGAIKVAVLRDGKVVAGTVLTEGFDEGVVRLRGYEFDTAKYELRPGVRAFGLRSTRGATLRSSSFEETVLRLFVLEDQALKEVLPPLVVDDESGAFDTVCKGDYRQRHMTLALGAAQADGWKQLLVTTRTQWRRPRGDADHCVDEMDPVQTARTVLRYKDGTYPVPTSLRWDR